jgi:uncharacterized protein (TIGR02646 family)
MVRLVEVELPSEALDQLAAWQSQIDAEQDFAERVRQADSAFRSHNHKRDSTFEAVKSSLTAMCSGARRCAYCEDSAADEVEHIRPKNLYPETVFVWANYVYACGPCNGPKGSKFAVFAADTGEFIEIKPDPAAPTPPCDGEPVLLSPRADDALEFLELDLDGTFLFQPAHGLGERDRQRADYTLKLLRLNCRDELQRARGEAFGDYRARLKEYVDAKIASAPAQQLDRLAKALRRKNHPTVWQEMKRQRADLPELRALFEQAPEALDW